MIKRRRPSDPVPSSIYTEEYFLSAACEGYDSYVAGSVSRIKQKELDLLEVRPGMLVLDVGCGRGEVGAELLRRGARVIGVDYSAAAVRLASEQFDGRAPVIRADASRLPFREGVFDRILLGDVIEHLPWPTAVHALAEAARSMRPGGLVLVHTAPNLWFARFVLPVMRRAFPILGLRGARDRLSQYEEDRDEMHPNELSPLGLHRLVRASGLTGRVWVDRDVLRGGANAWTSDIKDSRAWRAIAAVAGAWPFRLILGNDLYARVTRPGSDVQRPDDGKAADAFGKALAAHRERVDQVLPSGDPGAIKQLYVELGQLLEDAVGSDSEAIPALSFPEIAPVLGGLAADLGRRVLDAGCGPNPIFSIMLAPSRFMVSLDISWSIVRLAVSRAKAAGITIHGVVGDVEALPFREGVFDGSVCEDTIEHLPDDRSGASELARVLAPGGRVILGTPNRVRLDVLVARWRDRRSGKRRPDSDYYAATSHLREYTWRSLERLVQPWFDVRHRASVGWTHERYARTASLLVRRWPFRQFGRMVLLDLEKRKS